MKRAIDFGLPLLAIAGIVVGEIMGLWIAPAERHMGDVYRIIYVHVPAAWVALLSFLIAAAASFTFLFKTSWAADALAEAAGELGVLFGTVAYILGAIWGKGTWGVWWTPDPKLTAMAILVFGFAGYIALRNLTEEPERRAAWSAVVAIILAAGIPIVWFAVRWWGGLHQNQSTRDSMNVFMGATLGINVLAFTLLFVWFLRMRYRVAKTKLDEELSEPPEQELA